MNNPLRAHINPEIYTEQKVWEAEENEGYFSLERSRLEDLYRSETFFLPAVVKEVKSCLDVGCGYGGFSRIMKSFNPSLVYTGLDIIPQFVEKAQRRYPDCSFAVSDGIHLPFPDNSFDLVHSSGVLHINSHYQEMVRAMYRASSQYMLFDVRITKGSPIIGTIDINSNTHKNGYRALSYYVVNLNEFLDFLRTLNPTPVSIMAKGYPHPPNPTAHIPIDKVFMAFFLIQKSSHSDASPQVTIDLNA